jgi:hypothetical protein
MVPGLVSGGVTAPFMARFGKHSGIKYEGIRIGNKLFCGIWSTSSGG